LCSCSSMWFGDLELLDIETFDFKRQKVLKYPFFFKKRLSPFIFFEKRLRLFFFFLVFFKEKTDYSFHEKNF
jgi:hypothetical protein